jgi:hypothetical protein
MSATDELMHALGVSPETIERLRRLEAKVVEPTEADVQAVVWAVDLAIADERMIPPFAEWMNGVLVPRPTQRHENGTYTLLPSRVKRETRAWDLTPEEAREARARFLLWNSYYVRAYHMDRLSVIQKDAVRRLYWHGAVPPRDPALAFIDAEFHHAIKRVLHPAEAEGESSAPPAKKRTRRAKQEV